MMLMSSKVYQLRLSVNGITPEIWRRIYIADNISLANFHKIIQTTMGWFNSYSFYFKVGDIILGSPDEDIDDLRVDIGNISLRQVLRTPEKSITYHYDLIEKWEVSIVLEKSLPRNISFTNPICTEGERLGPLEDSGGVKGYNELVEILKDKKNPKFDEYSLWVGKNFNPNYFSNDEINAALAEDEYGSPEYEHRIFFDEDDAAFDLDPF